MEEEEVEEEEEGRRGGLYYKSSLLRCHRGTVKVKGLLLMSASALCFSFMTFTMHLIAIRDGIPGYQALFFRALLGFIGCVIYVSYYKINVLPISPRTRRLLVARTLVGIAGMAMSWIALSQLPFGEGTVVVFLSPMFTVLFARVILKEAIGIAGFIAVVLSLVGLLLVSRPAAIFPNASRKDEAIEIPHAPFSRNVAIIIGLCGAMFSALANVAVRLLHDVHPMVIVLYLTGAGIVCSPLLIPTQPPKLSGSVLVWVALLGIGFLGWLGQVLKTWSLSIEKAGIATMMRNIDLILGTVFQATVFSDTEPVQDLSVVGCVLLLFVTIYLGVVKLMSPREEKETFSLPLSHELPTMYARQSGDSDSDSDSDSDEVEDEDEDEVDGEAELNSVG